MTISGRSGGAGCISRRQPWPGPKTRSATGSPPPAAAMRNSPQISRRRGGGRRASDLPDRWPGRAVQQALLRQGLVVRQLPVVRPVLAVRRGPVVQQLPAVRPVLAVRQYLVVRPVLAAPRQRPLSPSPAASRTGTGSLPELTWPARDG